jgi:Cu(I)/Ag(I) efflux system membrane fusion protein
MALIPVPKTGDDGGEPGGAPRLTVSERAAALMSVQVWPVERLTLAGEARLFGTLAYDETLIHDVVVRADGQIEELHVAYESALVRAGQPLAEVYSPTVHAASLELLQARRAAASGGLPALVGAAAAQLTALGVSRTQVDAVLESGEPLRTFTVASPMGGVVAELAARQGEWLGAGARLVRVAGVETLWAQMEAFERELGSVAVGAPVEITVDAHPGRTFRGTISFVSPVVDGARRTARVRASVPNHDGRLKPGMLIRGRVGSGGARDAALAIPATAPLLTGRRAVVYVRVPDAEQPTFEARQVALGERRGDWWQVSDGLEEGELVVVNGAFRIDSELQIRGRPSMMSPDSDAAPPPSPSLSAPAAATPASRAAAGATGHALDPSGGRDLARVVEAYLEITRALSRDDAAGAQAAARTLEGALTAATPVGLAGDAADAWRHARDDMLGRAAAMERTADIAELRRELLPLSIRLERTVRMFPSPELGTLYRAVCPMVNDGDGPWLTREPVVENPYWGAAMFSCGEVQGKVSG